MYMKDYEILRAAADILQRKTSSLITGATGKTVTQDIAIALTTAGTMIPQIEYLRELADAFQRENENKGH